MKKICLLIQTASFRKIINFTEKNYGTRHSLTVELCVENLLKSSHTKVSILIELLYKSNKRKI